MIYLRFTLIVVSVAIFFGCAGDARVNRDSGIPDTSTFDTFFPPQDDASNPNLSCAGFGFAPSPPVAATDVTVSYQHAVPYSNVDLAITGIGTTTKEWINVTGGNGAPHTWSWKVTFSAAGTWQIKFIADQLDDEEDRPICTVQVLASG